MGLTSSHKGSVTWLIKNMVSQTLRNTLIGFSAITRSLMIQRIVGPLSNPAQMTNKRQDNPMDAEEEGRVRSDLDMDAQPLRYSNPRRPICNGVGKVQLGLHQLYNDHKHFKQCLIDFAIDQGFEFVSIKAARFRQTYKCAADGYSWRIHASKSPCGHYLMVKSYTP